MTPLKKKILVVDDQIVNRLLLGKILKEDYDVVEADSGDKALTILRDQKNVIQAVLLDLIMPGMDGYTFLEIVKSDSELCEIPILITTQSEGVEVEIKALALGAADYITKPYNNIVILQRIANIIALRENAILRNTSERDPLTFLYNKATFYKKVPEFLATHPDTQYAIVYIDIERFKIVNDFFGEKEGDKLLCYLAKVLHDYSDPKEMACSRHNGDIFVVCMPNSKENIKKYILKIIEKIDEYPLKFRLAINFGVYIIEDAELPVHAMCDRASLALESVVGKYDEHFAYYDDSHRNRLIEEQDIVNEMTTALAEGQFKVYLQPKFDLRDFSIVGAEALTRWIHPTKGFIAPDKFIPVFERNGFITELDFFVWDTTCQCLRKWLDMGWPVVPVSVNVSRVDIYRPDICDIFAGLLQKYKLPPELLELEITETAYTQNAEQLIETVLELKKLGFRLSMDDFGSGYSSLNMLNEVPVDVLKMDMALLKNLDEKNKSSNIINFVVSMAKWLNLSVISEGVETLEQVRFLCSVGCYHGQGYLFSKPLPIADFEDKILTHKRHEINSEESYSTLVSLEDIWDLNSTFNSLFNYFVGSLGLYEYREGKFILLRANTRFYEKIMPHNDELHPIVSDLFPFVFDEDKKGLIASLEKIKKENTEVVLDVRVHTPGIIGVCWHRADLKVIFNSEESTIFLASVQDISKFKTQELGIKQNVQRVKSMQSMLDKCSINSFEVNFEDKSLVSNASSLKNYELPNIIRDVAAFFTNGDFIHEPNIHEINAFFENLFLGKPSKELTFQCKKRDGTIHWAKLSYNIEFNSALLPTSGLCLLYDVCAEDKI